MPLRVRFLWDGEKYGLYALEFGDEHDYSAFRDVMRKDRPAEMATMIQRIERLANHGPGRKKQYFNHLEDGMWETKTTGGLRVTFFRYGPDIYIIDSCFAKKTQETKPADLERALEHREMFMERMAGGVKPPVLLRRDQEPLRKLT